MGLLGNRRIPRRCAKCGSQCMTTAAAIVHCRRPLATREPVHCAICGEECRTVRDAYRHCQQANTQRGGYSWRNYTTLQQQYEQRMQAVRDDPVAMAEIEAIVDFMLEQMPPLSGD